MKVLDIGLKFPREFTSNGQIKTIMLHHVAGNMNVYEIHAYHNRIGWNGIAYHYFIDFDGQIFKGRPDTAQGAGAENNNHGVIHICFNGNFEKENPTKEQLKNGGKLLVQLLSMHPDAWVLGHCDVNNTACPGKFFPLAMFKQIEKGFDYYRCLKLYTDLLDCDEYAINACKNAISSNIFKDGDGDEMLDFPKTFISRQDVAVLFNRLGFLKGEK